jgi:hypothetical protein
MSVMAYSIPDLKKPIHVMIREIPWQHNKNLRRYDKGIPGYTGSRKTQHHPVS